METRTNALWSLLVLGALLGSASCGDPPPDAGPLVIGGGSTSADTVSDSLVVDTLVADKGPCFGIRQANLDGPAWDRDRDGVSRLVEVEPLNAEFCLDTLLINTDPSEPGGLAYDGSLTSGLNLADRFASLPYYHDPGSDALDSDDWGAHELIRTLELASQCWTRYLRQVHREARPRIGVLDLSVRGGGPFPPHASHQNGLDMDVRYVRSDRAEAPLNLATADSVNFDLIGSLELMACFARQDSSVERIFVDPTLMGRFEDWTGGRISGVSGHHHHFHVRVRPDPPDVATGEARSPFRFASTTAVALQVPPRRAPTQRLQVTRPPPSLAQVATRQDTASAVRVDRATTVSVISPGMQARQVYAARAGHQLLSVSIAPTQDRVALLESTLSVTPGVPARSDLVILNAAGQEMYRDTAQVRSYTWCCRDQRRVAQLEGEEAEGGIGFVPTGLYITDPDQRTKTRVATDVDLRRVQWSAFDSTLYVEALNPGSGPRVFRYDADSGVLQPTPYLGVDFSSEGRFYLRPADERDPTTRVYRRSDNREVAVPDSLGRPVQWIYNDGNVLVLERTRLARTGETTPITGIRLTTPVTERIMYDVATARVIGPAAFDPTLVVPTRAIPQVQNNRLRLIQRRRPVPPG